MANQINQNQTKPQTKTQKPELIRANIFRKQYGISQVTEWKLAKKGILKPLYLGTLKYYKVADIESALSPTPNA